MPAAADESTSVFAVVAGYGVDVEYLAEPGSGWLARVRVWTRRRELLLDALMSDAGVDLLARQYPGFGPRPHELALKAACDVLYRERAAAVVTRALSHWAEERL